MQDDEQAHHGLHGDDGHVHDFRGQCVRHAEEGTGESGDAGVHASHGEDDEASAQPGAGGVGVDALEESLIAEFGVLS